MNCKFFTYLCAFLILASFSSSCQTECIPSDESIKILTWAGIPNEAAADALPVLKECGVDWHLAHCGDLENALRFLDEGQKAGIMIIPGLPLLKDSAEVVVAALSQHPALLAYNVKDEPEVWDISWLRSVNQKIKALDPAHPAYINLYPDWAWGGDKYEEHINIYADSLDTPFYSFDQYPVMRQDKEGNPYDGDGDAVIVIRDTWYRNLEVFSKMARQRNRPFWAFAMTTAHHLGPPSPPAYYPTPTIGHLRLQVYSDLLYGAQVIQYFTARGIYDSKTRTKSPAFDVIKQMNSEIKAYSYVFAGCSVKGVWHYGKKIPFCTQELDLMPHSSIKSISQIFKDCQSVNESCNGLLVSLLENKGEEYLVIQNKDCENMAYLKVEFKSKAESCQLDGRRQKAKEFYKDMEPGSIEVFKL